MSKAASSRSKFAELRALRESGKKRLDTYEVQQQEDLYEEVDEDGYKKVVRERLNQDDFVIDDNGEGYADDGREEWDRKPGYDTESEEDLPTKGKRGKAGMSILFTNHSMLMLLSKQKESVMKKRPNGKRWIRGSVIISRREVWRRKPRSR